MSDSPSQLDALVAFVTAPVPSFTTIDHRWLCEYKLEVLRWSRCAPPSAVLLPAPLSGWQGEPFSPRTPLGPSGAPGPALREARIARGLHPFDPRSNLEHPEVPA
jgi:hypothetical protein